MSEIVLILLLQYRYQLYPTSRMVILRSADAVVTGRTSPLLENISRTVSSVTTSLEYSFISARLIPVLRSDAGK